LDYDKWVNGLCGAFRRRCEDMQISLAAAKTTGLPTLFAPCQIYIIGSIDPLFQLMLVTCNASLPDMKRVVQIDVPALEFVAVLEAFKEREEFEIPRAYSHFLPPPGGHETLGGFLDRWLASILANGWTRIVRAQPGWMSTVNVGEGIFLSEFRGSVFDQSPERLATEMTDRLQQAVAPGFPKRYAPRRLIRERLLSGLMSFRLFKLVRVPSSPFVREHPGPYGTSDLQRW
jgi:hypothetical protein